MPQSPEIRRQEASAKSSRRDKLRQLYISDDSTSRRFQWTVTIVDIVIITFFIVSPILQDQAAFLWIDYGVAILLLADLTARAYAAKDVGKWLRRPAVLVDFVVLATLLLPLWLANLGFLRILRLWSLAQQDVFWRPLREGRYRDWEDLGRAGVNLRTCLFLITGFVFTAFAMPGAGIEGYIDALYFTVATVTTTGFGDITLPGPTGKLTSIVTMIVGISLFVRLAQALFKPFKVLFPCPRCGLQRHEPDVVHCKACGKLLSIPNEGD